MRALTVDCVAFLPLTFAKADDAMAPKSKKVETAIVSNKTAVVSGGASEGAPPTAPIVAGHDDTLSSHAIGSSGVPAPSVPSSPLLPLAQPKSSRQPTAMPGAWKSPTSLSSSKLPMKLSATGSSAASLWRSRKATSSKFMEAFSVDHLGDPEDTKKNSPAQKAWYARWQKQAHVVVVSIFEAKDKSHLEKCCWYLFDAIIKSHELGVLTMAANNRAASKLKCSKRLAATVVIVEKYAPVRLDVIKLWHIDEVAANPEAFVKRKLTNCWNNGIRAEKYAAKKKNGGKGVVREADDGEEAQATADGEEGGEEQAVADGEDGEAQAAASPPKSAKQARPPQPSATQPSTVEGTEKSGNKAKGKKSTNTKRARSAAPEPREAQPNKKPAVSRRRPAGKKAPVAVDTKGRGGGKDTSDGAEAEPTT
ncbi:hypothetical protein Q7P36_008568 [Cladosporium allicinum]